MNIPWFLPQFDQEDYDAINQCIRSSFVNQGPANQFFEHMLREYFDVEYAIMTPSGTTALSLSLMALGIGSVHSVIIPDTTFIGTASAVRLTGAEVILADVNPTDFNLNATDVESRIRANTRAIIAVHLNGRTADMASLNKIAAAHGVAIVEDAAEAIGARNEHGFLGTQSDSGCFSLAPTKIITSGQGGFVLTRNRSLYEKIIRLKDHGRLSRASDIHSVTGFNFKVTDLQAALATSQFKKLDRRIQRTREIDDLYREGLADLPGLSFPVRPPDNSYLMWPDFCTAHRDQLVTHLTQCGITVRPFWPALHTQPAYACAAAFPGAIFAASQACWLPASPGLSNHEIEYVIESIRSFFQLKES